MADAKQAAAAYAESEADDYVSTGAVRYQGLREGFLAGFAAAMSSPEVQNLVLALKKLKCAMWSENIDEQNDAYEFSIGALADMVAKQPGGSG